MNPEKLNDRQASGERTPVACWRVHSAFANFSKMSMLLMPASPQGKFVAAECADQHAASVRSPEKSLGAAAK